MKVMPPRWSILAIALLCAMDASAQAPGPGSRRTWRARAVPWRTRRPLRRHSPRDNAPTADRHRKDQRPRRRRRYGHADSAGADQHQLARCAVQPQRHDRQRRALRAGRAAGRALSPVRQQGWICGARIRTGAAVRSRQAARHHRRAGRSRKSISACRAAAPLPDASPTSSAIRSPTCRCRRCAINSSTASASSSTPGGRRRQTTLARTASSGSCRATTSSARRCVRTCRQGPRGAETEPTGYPGTYYPGVADVSQAQTVTAALGQELSSVGFPLVPARLVANLGNGDGIGWPSARRRDGDDSRARRQREWAALRMNIIGNGGGQVRPDGSFQLTNVPPGEYVLDVQQRPQNIRNLQDINLSQLEFASMPLSVSGGDIDNLTS